MNTLSTSANGIRYELLRPLGKGGMAQVYLARAIHPGGFEKVVAYKKVLPEMAAMPEARELFLREARLGAQLDHPFIVHVFDGGLRGDDLFLASEYVDGGDLYGVIEAMRRGGPRLPPEAAALIVSQLCQALAHLFSLRDPEGRRLVSAHRDISPGNVLCTRSGVVKLSDFGVVRLEDSHTAVGIVRGKWDYFGPEIAQGIVDGRGDLFALGVVLYELLTLGHPFDAPSPQERFGRAREADPTPSAEIPADLWPVVAKALSRDVSQRYQTPEAFGEALEGYLFAQQKRMSPQVLARLLAPLQLAPAPVESAPLLLTQAVPASVDQALSAEGCAPTRLSVPTPVPRSAPTPVAPVAPTAMAAPVAPLAVPPVVTSAPRRSLRAPRWMLASFTALAVAAVVGGVHAAGRPALAPFAGPVVSVVSDPPGAEVFVGSERLGTTPLVLPNAYPENALVTLEVVRDGYTSARLAFLGGHPSQLSAELRKR